METINNKIDGAFLFKVTLWCGVGYLTSGFCVYANDEEEAMERVLAFIEKNDFVELFWTDDYIESKMEITELEKDEMFLYIDPTMTDNSAYPAYVLNENLGIEKLGIVA